MANELPSSVQKDSIDWELEAVGEDGEEMNTHKTQAPFAPLYNPNPNPNPDPNPNPNPNPYPLTPNPHPHPNPNPNP